MGRLKRFLDRPKTKKISLTVLESGIDSRTLAHSRFLNRCFSSLKAEYTGRYRRRYSESSNEFGHFVTLARRFQDSYRRTGVKVDVPSYFRAHFDFYGGTKTFPGHTVGKKSWFWYRRYILKKTAAIVSLSNSEREAYYQSLITELAETWQTSEDDIRKRFGSWVGEHAEVSI